MAKEMSLRRDEEWYHLHMPSDSTKKPKPPERFEDAFDRLGEIVGSLESGTVSLEDSLALYAEGMALVKFCGGKLENARIKIEQLNAASAGDARDDG